VRASVAGMKTLSEVRTLQRRRNDAFRKSSNARRSTLSDRLGKQSQRPLKSEKPTYLDAAGAARVEREIERVL
jgi:hypothetical protein